MSRDMLTYKIFRATEWTDLQTKGETFGAPIDVADGYVHLSTAEQAPTTAALYFAGATDLVLVAIDDKTTGDAMKWEPSRGGQLFPHLYRKLSMADVLWHRDLPLVDGTHDFGDL